MQREVSSGGELLEWQAVGMTYCYFKKPRKNKSVGLELDT